MTKQQLAFELPEPEILVRQRELTAKRDAAVRELVSPSRTLETWQGLEGAVAELRLQASPLKRIQRYTRLASDWSVAYCEWVEDDWHVHVHVAADLEFFPLARDRGFALGLYLESSLLESGEDPPVVFY